MQQTSSKMLAKIIKHNRVEGAVFKSHSSMIKPKGGLQLNRQTIELMFDSIIEEINKETYTMGMAEIPQKYLPVIADIDLKIPGNEPRKLYTIKIVKKLISIYQNIINEITENLTPKELHCVFLAKEPYTTQINGVNFIKHGFHLHFPYIFLNKISQENHIIPAVKKQVSELKLFESLGYTDSADTIDKCCLSVPWLMYGSKKDGEQNTPYLLKYVFNSQLEKVNIEDAFKNYSIYNDSERKIDIEGNVEKYLPRILSIIPYNREVKDIKPSLVKLDELKIEERKDRIQDNKIYDIPNPEDEKTENICRKLLKCLSDIRAEERMDWLTIGWILNNVFDGNDTGLELWKEFAQRCPDKYDDETHNNTWLKMEKRTDYSLGTLHYWAKQDNSTAYSQFKKEIYGTTIQFELQDEIPWDEYTKAIAEHCVAPPNVQPPKDAIAAGKEHDDKIKLYNKTKNAILRDMNNYICVVKGCAKPYFIIRQFKVDNLGIKYIEYIRQCKKALIESYENKYCYPVPTKPGDKKEKPKTWISIWISWDGRRTYNSEVFQSQNLHCPTNTFNTFHGFNISRELANEKGTQDVSHFFDFIKNCWCNGNEEQYNWTVGWLAFSIQNPLIKMLSAIVLRGEEGIGKGMIIQKLGEIIGPQFFIQPASIDDVLGTFNGIVANKAIVFLDEMVWGGDKQKSGVLKKLITESKSTINEKNLPQRPTTTVFNLIISSNEDWVVPAGNNARRYMMLDVLNTHSKEEKDAVRLACPYSVAKFLYERDISDFDHSNIIATSALASQKEQSAPDAHKFIIDQVRAGELPFEDKISFETLYEQFKSMYPHNRFTRVQTFSRDIKKIIDYKIYRNGNSKREMKIPSEENCRKSINAYYRQDMFINLPEEETEE